MQITEERIKEVVREETDQVLQEIAPALAALGSRIGGAAMKLGKSAAAKGLKGAGKLAMKGAKAGGKMAMDMGRAGVKNMAKQVLKDPTAKQQVQGALKGIASAGGPTGANLGAVKQNPIQSAMFIANLIPQFGMTVPQFIQIASMMSENNQKKVVEILKNSKKLLKQAVLSEKKKKEPESSFSPSQTPAEADATFSQCMKDAEVDPDPGVSEEEAKARVCTDTRKVSGASLDWGEEREKEVQRARKGGKSG